VRRTAGALAFICPRWWPNNHGYVLVVPIRHYENLYELPPEAGHAVHDLVRDVAIAIRRTYGCEGVSTRQHNEPAGNQDAWHYHVHVFPRYDGDQLYTSRPYPEFVTAEQRQPFAATSPRKS
jgi:histidine triad (HIT) family protein